MFCWLLFILLCYCVDHMSIFLVFQFWYAECDCFVILICVFIFISFNFDIFLFSMFYYVFLIQANIFNNCLTLIVCEMRRMVKVISRKQDFVPSGFRIHFYIDTHFITKYDVVVVIFNIFFPFYFIFFYSKFIFIYIFLSCFWFAWNTTL